MFKPGGGGGGGGYSGGDGGFIAGGGGSFNTGANQVPVAGVGLGNGQLRIEPLTTPSLTAVKSSPDTTYSAVGEVLDYEIEVTNTGNVTLTSLSIADTLTGDESCPVVSLAPTVSTTCTATYTVTQADIDAGSVSNTASINTDQTAPQDTNELTIDATLTPSLTAVKSSPDTTYSAVGEVLDYEIEVTNTGNVTLTSLSIADTLTGDESCPVASLAPTASTTCTATYTVTQADIDAGSVSNTASIDTDQTDPQNTNELTITATQTPSLTAVKSSPDTTYSAVGEVLDYEIEVTNTGNVTLTSLSIDDTLTGDESCPVASLAPTASTTCTATYTVTQADIDAGSVSNTASIDTDQTDPQNTNELTITATQTPSLTLAKSVNPPTYSAVGDTLTYTYTLTNDGNVTLANITTTDSVLGSVCSVSPLAPGQIETCNAPYSVTQADIDARAVTNTARAEGLDPNGATVLSNEASTTANALLGSITIVKAVAGGTLTANQKFGFDGGNLGAFSLPSGGSFEETFSDLQSVQFTIAETSQPNKAWTLASITCDAQDYSVNGSAVIVNLNPGETATCTFTNSFDQVDEKMGDVARLFVRRRVDNLLTHGPDRARMLRRLQTQAPTSSNNGPLGFSASGSGGSQPRGSGSSMNSVGAMSLGGALAYNSNSTVAEDGVPWINDSFTSSKREEMFGTSTGPTSTSSSLLSAIASQLTPLAAGQTSFKFGTSLSEIRRKAAEAEARAQQKKLQEAGLSFDAQPYTNPFLALRPGLDIWVEGHISRYNDDIGGISRKGDFRILYVGADYVIAPGILVGALVQVDDTKEDVDNPTLKGDVEGTGWMVGPYFGAKLLDNLYFDARAAWGQSNNDIKLSDPVLGTRSGSFDTDRWLATATLTGNHYFGGWRISPEAGLAYGHESYDAFKNSLGQTVYGADANIGRLTGGAEVAYRMQTMNGTIIEPMVGIEGIWNFDSDDLVINGVLQNSDDNRAKVEGGVLVRTPSGWGVRAAGTYDGIGSGDFESYGGSLWVNVPLN